MARASAVAILDATPTECVGAIDIEEECSKPDTLDDSGFEIRGERLIDVTAIDLRQARLSAKRLCIWWISRSGGAQMNGIMKKEGAELLPAHLSSPDSRDDFFREGPALGDVLKRVAIIVKSKRPMIGQKRTLVFS